MRGNFRVLCPCVMLKFLFYFKFYVFFNVLHICTVTQLCISKDIFSKGYMFASRMLF